MHENSDEAWAVENGYSQELFEVEQAYNGKYYLLGHAPTQPLGEIKTNKLTEINTAYTNAVSVARVGVPEDEVLTWDIQKLEAQAWSVDSTVSTPFVDGLALGRDMDRVELLEKILVKVEAYQALVSYATGVRQRLEDAINSAEMVEEVNAIAWPTTDTITEETDNGD